MPESAVDGVVGEPGAVEEAIVEFDADGNPVQPEVNETPVDTAQQDVEKL